jgi:hypothetical protein
MNKQSVIIDYSKLADDKLTLLTLSIIALLTGNEYFTLKAELLARLKELNAEFSKWVVKAKTGTSQDVASKNFAKGLLCDCIRELGLEINLQAKGDTLKLQSSGLTLAKERKKTSTLPKPEGLKVIGGDNMGDFLCSIDVCKDARFYNFYSALAPAPANINEWRLTPSSTHKKNISGFTPGKEYEFKCAYQGSEDSLLYSDTIKVFAH